MQESGITSPDGPAGGGEVEVTLVTMVFETGGDEDAAGRLLGVLAKYVVVSRQQPGCRNIDLCQSVTTPGRYVVIEKWESPEAQRAHFDSPDMVEMARSCQGLLARKPDIDLLEGLSAHDLR
ncbi:MAG: antibiotic biosynthesis monooxygenase [Actinobacteria bacterium]|nr:MAG: antibiotic biosynthesis monooxygenase [Actinomycetota bacterium]